jgi:hypothetical protein
MNNDVIIKTNVDDPNSELIANFFRVEFPLLVGGNVESLVSIITSKMVGTRNYRLAGCPNPESEVAIRDVIRLSIESGKPIPVLIVCGPKKPVIGESIDIAELSALRIIACVQRQVQEVYPAGLDVRLRLEDSTGYYLEGTSVPIVESMEKYITDLSTLVRILGYDSFITPIRESSLGNPVIFREIANKLYPHFFNYLMHSSEVPVNEWSNLKSFKILQENGWSGLIPPEMREYYHHRYTLLFPSYNEFARTEMIAKYFAITLARPRVNGIGANPEWNNKFIQINFAPPVTGEPTNRTTTRLYYRTTLLSHTKRHLPFWRAKGYLKLNGSVRISLATWNEELDLNPFEVEISKGNDKVIIKADYMFEH